MASAFRRRGRPMSSHDPGRPERAPLRPSGAPRRARERGPCPSQVSPSGAGAQATSPLSTAAHARFPPRRAGPAAPGPVVPARLGPTPQWGPPGAPPPRRLVRARPGPGLLPSGPRRTGPDSGWLAFSGAQESTHDLPRPPVAGVTLPPNQLAGSGLTKVLAERSAAMAGQAVRPGPSGSPQRPLERASCARAGRRTRGGQASAKRGVLGCCPACHSVTQGRRWHVEGAQRAQGLACRRGPGAGHQRPGMAAGRVAHGQAQGMKESLSSGDTVAVSSGLPLPRP